MSCDADKLALLLDAEPRLTRARGVLERAGSLWALAQASPRQLERRGLSATEAERLLAAFVVGARALASPRLPVRIGSPDDALACVSALFLGAQRERFVVVVLDVKNRPRHVGVVAEGSELQCPVDPRVVLRLGLEERGAALIVAHNHPSGDAEPSAEDLGLTRRLAAAGAAVGLPLLDHLIVGSVAPPRFVSLAASGVLGASAYKGGKR